MFVFIAHAEADQAAAEELKAFLKTRGLVAETETGARGFRHLQASDVVVALWSQKSVFGAQRMMMEKRMLDAWADERLVLVKLDHSFLPVGMRDLPAIDASFETGRQLSVWPKVERQAKAAMNAGLVKREAQDREVADESSAALGGSARRFDVFIAYKSEDASLARDLERALDAEGFDVGSADEAAAQANWPQATAQVREASQVVVLWTKGAADSAYVTGAARLAAEKGRLLAALVGMSSLGILNLPKPSIFALPRGPVALDLTDWDGQSSHTVFQQLVMVLGRRSPRRQIRGGRAAEKEAVAPAPPAVGTGTAAPQAVFISYSHADGDAVTRVVAVVEASGRAVWIDKQKIGTGEGWAGEIVRGIKGATRVMVMCSPNAFESDHIKREVYLADRYKKPMLPVFIAEAQPPEDFEYFFAGVQWLELFKLPEAERPAAIGKALGAV